MRGILVSLLGLVLMAGFSAATLVYLNPNGNGAYSQWSNVGCASTSEYQCVDEDPSSHDSSDYLYSSAPLKDETFAFENLGTCSAVTYVALGYYARNYDSSHYAFQSTMRISGVIYNGTLIETLNSTSYQWYFGGYYYTNPATRVAWTCAEVNNLEAGMRTLNSGLGGARVATMYARVSYT